MNKEIYMKINKMTIIFPDEKNTTDFLKKCLGFNMIDQIGKIDQSKEYKSEIEFALDPSYTEKFVAWNFDKYEFRTYKEFMAKYRIAPRTPIWIGKIDRHAYEFKHNLYVRIVPDMYFKKVPGGKFLVKRIPANFTPSGFKVFISRRPTTVSPKSPSEINFNYIDKIWKYLVDKKNGRILEMVKQK